MLRTSRAEPSTFLALFYDGFLGYSATSHALRKTAFMTALMFVFFISAVIKLTARLRLLAFITFLGHHLFLTLISCTIPKDMCDTLSLVWVRHRGLGLCFWPSLCSSICLVFVSEGLLFYCFYPIHGTNHSSQLRSSYFSTDFHNWHTLGIDRYDMRSLPFGPGFSVQIPVWASSLHTFCTEAFPWHYFNARPSVQLCPLGGRVHAMDVPSVQRCPCIFWNVSIL